MGARSSRCRIRNHRNQNANVTFLFHGAPMTRWFFSIALLCVAATAAAQQDVVTVGSVTANGSVVDVPVSIRDVSGTPLGIDRPAGSKIQAFSIKVSYAPASAVSAITFSRSGITAGLTP